MFRTDGPVCSNSSFPGNDGMTACRLGGGKDFMPLIQLLSRYFSRTTRLRGENYALSQRVEILDGSESSVEAEVAGTEAYSVSVELDGDILIGACNCPYAEGGEACKHIWATLSVAEKQGHLRAANKLSRLTFALNAPDDFGVDDFETDVTRETMASRQTFSQPSRAAKGINAATGVQPAPIAKPPQWKKVFTELRQRVPLEARSREANKPWPASRQILYVIDIQASKNVTNALVLELAYREPKKNGDWSKPRGLQLAVQQISQLTDPRDIEIMTRLIGARDISYYGYSYGSQQVATRYELPSVVSESLMPLMCATGRCFYRLARNMDLSLPLAWESGLSWELRLRVDESLNRKSFRITSHLQRGEQKLTLNEPTLIHPAGVVIAHGWVSSLKADQPLEWLQTLQAHPEIQVPKDHAEELLEELIQLERRPQMEIPPELQVEQIHVPPRFRLRITKPKLSSWQRREEFLAVALHLDYDGSTIPWGSLERGVLRKSERRFLVRDLAAEDEAARLLRALKFRNPGAYTYGYNPSQKQGDFELLPKHLPTAVATLTAAGWTVEAQGQLYRMPGQFQIEVRSGIDWFELHGAVDFDGQTANLPELLQALKRGERMVRLGDNSYGMLPEDWLRKYGLLANLGQSAKDHLRFSPGQAGLLDILLAEQPQATCDATFEEVRRQLRSYEGIEPSDPAGEFRGALRGYQKEGLGWLHFLRRFRFGGCLADDMGLGKTVQVLALLESRRAERMAGGLPESPGSASQQCERSSMGISQPDRVMYPPSLIVMPRSLIFNWKQEAARFAPRLRLLEHTGGERVRSGSHFGEYDVVLTTYGTLRRDAAHLREQEFDYVILDEAQAIKNARTDSAKAVRLLNGRHRLALSGTPVENHLGELWSLFEFLNPGMLGTASVFGLANSSKNVDEETRRLLARALRPFILRRTKQQVAKDLPSKLEQTLYCELKAEQRRQYDDLKEHYRQTLLGRIETEGLQKAKIHVLEALLRLRQAACHPGLLDKKRIADPSAKLDMLLPQIAEVVDEGHKALVFSQFTSLLAIVRDRLDAEKIPYVYLDGKTRDRASLVEKFQTDPESRLFLISLKAGGLGLNLTAAEYVFLLDPWWNPAVEAQAIDRTHRIGQTRQVFAYRLIARDTVEEKVLQLQESKRNLADAIIREDNSLIRDLSREDLELLLG